MDTTLQDFRYAVRRLLRSPGFTIVTVITLALGIGANSAIFSVVNSVLLRPLPYPDPDRIVMVWGRFASEDLDEVHTSEPEFLDYKRSLKSFSHLSVFVSRNMALSDDTGAEMVPGLFASADLFPLLGARAILGRPFLAEEDRPGNEQVVVLSHGLWRRRFGSDRDLIGKPVMINGKSYTVVGVMGPEFRFPAEAELWLPLAIDPAKLETRAGHYLDLIARIKPGISLEQAEAELASFANTMTQMYPFFYSAESGWQLNLVPLQQQIVGDVRLVLIVLLCSVAFVLLIACVNVANLLLVRAQRQHKEISLRAALGASWWRLVRQLLMESLLLSLLGGCLGLLVADWGIKVLVARQARDLPRIGEIHTDGWVLAFTLALTLLTALLVSLIPALRSFKIDLGETLKEGGRGAEDGVRVRARSLLVVVEIALALVLLIGSGLLIGGLYKLTRIDPGFQAQEVMSMRLSLPRARYPENWQLAAFYREMLGSVEKLPTVKAAGLISELPFGTESRNVTFNVEGRPHFEEGRPASITHPRAVSPDYFRAIGIPLIKGRVFTAQDRDQAALVTVIDEVMAQRFWPGEEVIGKRVSILQGFGPGPWMTIVGVVGAVKEGALESQPEPHLYYPFEQNPARGMYLAVRVRQGEPEEVVKDIRRQVRSLDGMVPLHEVMSMEDRLSQSIAKQSLTAQLIFLFAALAVILAAVGLYGVMSYSVLQRSHEIGVRMALGAQRRDILQMILRQGLAMAILGVVFGLLAAVGMTRLIASLLYGVSATEPGVYVGASLLLTGVAMVASYLPARRTTRLDPVIALRS